IFLRDRLLGSTTRISNKSDGSQSNAGSGAPNISGDGSRIVFPSFGQLVPNARFNNCYLFDRSNGTMQLLDWQPNGVAGTTSAGFNNGCWFDRSNGTRQLHDWQPNGVAGTTCDGVSIDYAGRRAALVSNFGLERSNPGSREVYVRDLVAATTTRVSRAVGGGH